MNIYFFFKILLFFLFVFKVLCVHTNTHERRCPQKPEEHVKTLGAGVIGHCKLSGIHDRNQLKFSGRVEITLNC